MPKRRIQLMEEMAFCLGSWTIMHLTPMSKNRRDSFNIEQKEIAIGLLDWSVTYKLSDPALAQEFQRQCCWIICQMPFFDHDEQLLLVIEKSHQSKLFATAFNAALSLVKNPAYVSHALNVMDHLEPNFELKHCRWATGYLRTFVASKALESLDEERLTRVIGKLER